MSVSSELSQNPSQASARATGLSSPSPQGEPSGASVDRPLDAAELLIESRVAEAQNALWWSELIRSVLAILITVFTIILIWVIADQWIYSPGLFLRTVAWAALIAWVAWQFAKRTLPILRGTICPEYAARSLERDLPEMRQDLTSFITLRNQPSHSVLANKVIRSVGAHAASRLKKHDSLPLEATGTMAWWLVTAAVLALMVLYSAVSPKNSLQSASRLINPIAAIEPAKRVRIRNVMPGDATVMAGRAIEVSAQVDGLRAKEAAICQWQLADRKVEVGLERDSESGLFTGAIPLDHSSTGKVAYRVIAGDDVAGPFYLSVEDVPVVAIQSIRYQPPNYTGKQPHTSSSAAITAIDGTEVTLQATTNRPVQKAVIQFNPRPLQDTVQATAGVNEMQIDESGTRLTIQFKLRHAGDRSAAVQLDSYLIKVSDVNDQSNPNPIIYPIRVIADLAPEITIVMPRQSPRDVPIDAQQIIEIHAADADFGLQRIELDIRKGTNQIARPTLMRHDFGLKGNQVAEYRFRPQELGLRIGDSVQVVGIATDNRFDADDTFIQPNVKATDSLQLNIVESGPVPDQPVAGDGLSSPDDQPAAQDQQSDNKSPDEENGEKSGEGEPGSMGSGGEQSGGEQSGGEQSGGEQSGGEQSGGEQSGGEQSGGEQSGGEQSGGEQSGGEQSGGEQSGGEQSGGEQSGGEQSGGEQSGGEQSGGEQSGGPESAGDAAGDQQRSGDESPKETSGDSQGNESNEAPQHDGEAFERIRDYLDQKKQQQTADQRAAREDQASSGAKTDSASGEQTADAGPDDAQPKDAQPNDQNEGQSQAPTGQRGGQQDESGKESSSAEQDSTDQESAAAADNGQGPDATQPNSESDTMAQQEGASEQAGMTEDTNDAGSESSQAQPQPGGESSGSDGSTESSGQPEGGPSGDSSGESAGESTAQDSDAPSPPDSQASGEQRESPESSDASSDPSGASSQGAGSSQSRRDSAEPSNEASNESSQTSQQSTGEQSTGEGATGEGSGTGVGDDTADTSPPTPDPVDLDYAKKATDMVLDYLNETRDKPDQELLEDLNWTEQDLQRFADRWRDVRELEQSDFADPDQQRNVAEALKSLGIRSPTTTQSQRREQADAIRDLQDAGNRRPPPAAYRDAFDAFRRAIGGQNR